MGKRTQRGFPDYFQIIFDKPEELLIFSKQEKLRRHNKKMRTQFIYNWNHLQVFDISFTENKQEMTHSLAYSSLSGIVSQESSE